ncbi:hypothetical protein IAT38_007963 [Cryptococcus sp. DSM 104549]
MLFTKIALLALPFIGAAFASPVKPVDDVANLLKRDSVLDVANALKSAVADPIATLNTPNVSQDDATSALTSIKAAIASATTSIGTATAARRSLGAVSDDLAKRDDLNEVGEVLANVIEDLVKAIEQLADDLKSFPLIGALIIDIDGGLHTLLLGVEIVLKGVIQILQGLLKGLGDLLSSLGNGLLAGEYCFFVALWGGG